MADKRPRVSKAQRRIHFREKLLATQSYILCALFVFAKSVGIGMELLQVEGQKATKIKNLGAHQLFSDWKWVEHQRISNASFRRNSRCSYASAHSKQIEPLCQSCWTVLRKRSSGRRSGWWVLMFQSLVLLLENLYSHWRNSFSSVQNLDSHWRSWVPHRLNWFSVTLKHTRRSTATCSRNSFTRFERHVRYRM